MTDQDDEQRRRDVEEIRQGINPAGGEPHPSFDFDISPMTQEDIDTMRDWPSSPTGSTEMSMTGHITVYVAMISDRHTDPEAHVFSTLGPAIDYARRHAQESATRPDDFQETPVDGWLYHATYSVENDAVWVVGATVDEPESR